MRRTWQELKPMTWDGFTEWLKSKQPDEVVGTTRAACGCPLARYLADLNGYDAWVDGKTYGVRWCLPQVNEFGLDAKLFIRTVDVRFIGFHEITARECLDVVEGRIALQMVHSS